MTPPIKRGAYTALGYRAAQIERSSGRPQATGGSADYHLRYDREDLVQQSQAFDRDNAIFEGLANRAADNILGHGFKLQAQTSSEEVNKQLEQLWAEWSEAPEVRELDTFWQIERLVLRALMVDGDIGAIKTSDGKIQLIESERVAYRSQVSDNKENRVEQGVELDKLGRPVRFWIADYNRFGNLSRSKYTPINASDFIFIANRKRASQTRGVPVHVSSFPMIHRINDVCDSEAVAWQILARYAIIVTRNKGAEQAYLETTADSDAPANSGSEQRPDRVQDQGPDRFSEGAIAFHGEEGEDLKAVEHNLPGANFPESIRMFLRLIGLPFGLPLELILLDFSQTNYSSARASLEQAYRNFQCWQRLLKQKWHAPLYRWKVQQWIAEGKIKSAPADVLKHDWIAPKFPWVDPFKEAQAWKHIIGTGLSTHAEALASRGQDYDDWRAQRQKEIVGAVRAAQEVEKTTGVKVPWELLAGLEVAKAEMPADPAESTEKDEDAESEKRQKPK